MKGHSWELRTAKAQRSLGANVMRRVHGARRLANPQGHLRGPRGKGNAVHDVPWPYLCSCLRKPPALARASDWFASVPLFLVEYFYR